MTTYFLLVHFTDQGIRDIKDTIGRAEAFEQMAKEKRRHPATSFSGGHGPLRRVIAVFDAPDRCERRGAHLERLLAWQCAVGNPARLLVRGQATRQSRKMV